MKSRVETKKEGTFVSAFTLTQEADSCSSEGLQYLDVRIVSGGNGHYVVLHTERWAADPDDLRILTKQIQKHINAADRALGEGL